MSGLGAWGEFFQDSVNTLLGYLERIAEACERVADAAEEQAGDGAAED